MEDNGCRENIFPVGKDNFLGIGTECQIGVGSVNICEARLEGMVTITPVEPWLVLWNHSKWNDRWEN